MSEEYDYEYGSEGWPEEGSDRDETEVQVENTFYQAEDVMNSDPETAITMFKEVLEMEKDTSKEQK